MSLTQQHISHLKISGSCRITSLLFYLQHIYHGINILYVKILFRHLMLIWCLNTYPQYTEEGRLTLDICKMRILGSGNKKKPWNISNLNKEFISVPSNNPEGRWIRLMWRQHGSRLLVLFVCLLLLLLLLFGGGVYFTEIPLTSLEQRC